MQIVYASKTGNIKRFINKFFKEFIDNHIITGNEIIIKDCILFTYTTGIGEIPKEVDLFISNNLQHIKGIVGSGNKNWGLSYCKACDLIKNQYYIPILYKFELSGNENDYLTLKEKLK